MTFALQINGVSTGGMTASYNFSNAAKIVSVLNFICPGARLRDCVSGERSSDFPGKPSQSD